MHLKSIRLKRTYEKNSDKAFESNAHSFLVMDDNNNINENTRNMIILLKMLFGYNSKFITMHKNRQKEDGGGKEK